MKILTAEQIREADRYTIENEPVASIDLMERAAAACSQRIADLVKPSAEIHLYCGMGNNGGDGLAITRQLLEKKYKCTAFLVKFRDKMSPDAAGNLQKLSEHFPDSLMEIKDASGFFPPNDAVAVDALLGTGGTDRGGGILEESIRYINKSYKQIISIDLPSGMLPDGGQKGQPIIRSTLTLTFQLPKMSLLLPENGPFAGRFEILDIGLSSRAIEEASSKRHYVTAADVATLLRPRSRFSHKGTFGHALLLAGSRGKTGAALMAAEACLRSGAGLLTVHSTPGTLAALTVRLPEAMGSEDDHSEMITQVDHPENYHAVAFGPGTGTSDDTAVVLKKILQHGVQKLVIDADGLNILAENKTWLEFLPPAAILTPHTGEWARLAGKAADDHERIKHLLEFAYRHNCIVILKGAHTCIAMPDGNLFFNSSGNPGLAKGGSGDALTGVILGLLASGYTPPQAAIIGVFLHGFAADLCRESMAEESMLANDVISHLGKALQALRRKYQDPS